MSKTDITENIGKHKFELAGLGLAPFRFIGCSTNVITYPDGTTKAGSSCDYCGTGIANECHVKSADGRLFKVGCDCIAKVGDSGLLKAYRSSPAFRAKARLTRQAKDKAVSVELYSLLAANAARFAAEPHPYGFTDRETGKPLNKLDQIKWSIGRCGAAGRASWLRTLKKLVAAPVAQAV